MTFTLSPWVVIGVLWLALFGAAWWWRVARQVVRDAWAWWRHDRVSPLLEDEECPVCHDTYFDLHAHLASGAKGCGDAGPLEELPPERSREELGFTELDLPRMGGRLTARGFEPYAVGRERRAPKWEAEARGHYVAMGLDYPSGLMARVREGVR